MKSPAKPKKAPRPKRATGRKVAVRPVTPENWRDFVRLFTSKGAPHYCWCSSYRQRDAKHLDNDEKKQLMQELVSRKIPIGVLAFDGDEPVGWCSIAPRESYIRLEKSRTMPRATPLTAPTWSVLCFFVARSHRKQGVSEALLEGAVAYAKRRGAKIVEGYPFDTAGISSTHRGHSKAFESAGFRQEGKRWAKAIRGSTRT